jgi:hypothetical protein
MSENLVDILQNFDPISLKEMDGVKLLKRTDTKYLLSLTELKAILPQLLDDYKVLEIGERRISSYQTTYLDTEEKTYFHQHHQGRYKRHKVRFRSYKDSGATYLEVKLKQKGQTNKKRISVQKDDDFSTEEQAFLKKWIPEHHSELKHSLKNQFQRITLVNKNLPERLTIDLNLSFEYNNKEIALSDHVVLELKQEKFNRKSFILTLLRLKGLRPIRVSKYCMGLLLLEDNLKYNRFKSRLLQLNKIRKVWNF